jgi:hypothetical protein
MMHFRTVRTSIDPVGQEGAGFESGRWKSGEVVNFNVFSKCGVSPGERTDREERDMAVIR